MNSRFYLFFLFALSTTTILAQSFNMTLQSNWDENSVVHSGIYYNDVWGYVDGENNEYAIVGSPTKIQFVDVTNPNNPSLVDLFYGGAAATWRDFKTYGQYAYAVADEGSEGLIIFDLSDIQNGNITKVYQQNNMFNRAHNIYIDPPNGRLYVTGSDTRNSGLIVYDLSVNPANPAVIGNMNLQGGYVHDIFVLNNTAYCSHGYNGLYVYDFTSASNPINVASIVTGGYNHSSWINEDRSQLIYAEEIPEGRPLGLIDLAGVNDNDLEITSTFRFPLISNNNNVTYHNPYIVDNYAFISSYNDGVVVLDIADPYNPQRVAYYDTYPTNTGYSGLGGCWGVYPFLPSGTIIATDTQYGLFVLSTSITTTTDCGNGAQDDFEIDVDCGGFCGPCLEEPTCSDGIQNGNETGVDCGGPDCLACSATSYCDSQGGDDAYDYIAGVEFGAINNSTPASGGYANFTSINTNVTINSTTTITLTPGFQGTAYTEYWRVWIDYNQDGDFTDANELAYDIGVASENVTTGSITVPSTALTGSTRMRVSMKYYDAADDSTLPEPCASFAYGEVEDYTLTIVATSSCTDGIQNGDETDVDCGGANCPTCPTCFDGIQNGNETGVDCGGPDCLACATCTDGIQNGDETGVDCGGASCVPCSTASCNPPSNIASTVLSGQCVKLTWNAEPAPVDKYKVRYRLVGGTWTEYNAKYTLSFINDLTLNSIYEFQVKTNCIPGQSSSGWSIIYSFTTLGDDCDRPQSITVSGVTSNAAAVYWTPTANDLKYKVGYKKNGDSGYTQILVNAPASSYALTGLLAGNDYKATVKTKCAGGWTNWTPKDDFATLSNLVVQPFNMLKTNECTIYPNPVTDLLNINYYSESQKDIELHVFDIVGRLVMSKDITIDAGENNIQLDVAQLQVGSHYISIQQGDQKITQRFVKL